MAFGIYTTLTLLPKNHSRVHHLELYLSEDACNAHFHRNRKLRRGQRLPPSVTARPKRRRGGESPRNEHPTSKLHVESQCSWTRGRDTQAQRGPRARGQKQARRLLLAWTLRTHAGFSYETHSSSQCLVLAMDSSQKESKMYYFKSLL